MSLINQIKILTVKAPAGNNLTTVTSDTVDAKLCEGVLFFTALPDAQAASNFLKIQASADPTFNTGVLDIIGAIGAPKINGDIVAVDVSEIPLRYIRAKIVKAGPTAFSTAPIYAFKYGTPKQPTINDGTEGAVGVSIETIETTEATGTIERPQITNPDANSENVSLDETITSSAYAVRDGADTHDKSQYQITEIITTPVEDGDPIIIINFDAPVLDTETPTGAESLVLAGTELQTATPYAIRARYYSTTLGWSDWSEVLHFTTADGAQ